MTIERFIKLAKRYNELGWAIQNQLDQVLGNAELGTLNDNALMVIADFLDEAGDELNDEAASIAAEEIREHLDRPEDWTGGDDEDEDDGECAR